MGSFAIENKGEESCRFEIRGTGLLNFDMAAKLEPGQHFVFPLWFAVPGGRCRLEGGLEIQPTDAWTSSRAIPIRAIADPEAPSYVLHQPHAAFEACPRVPEAEVSIDLQPVQLRRRWSWEAWPEDPPGLQNDSEDLIRRYRRTDCGTRNTRIRIPGIGGRDAFVSLGLGMHPECDVRSGTLHDHPWMQVDEFLSCGEPKADIVFFIDDSASMSPFVDGMAANLRRLAEFAARIGIDARLSMVGVESGWVRDGEGRRQWFDVGEESQRSAFVDALRSIAWDGALERSFDSMLRRLPEASLRSEAVLITFLISDEDDQSLASVDETVDRLLEIKGLRNTQLFATHVVSGGEDGCSAG